MEIDVRNCNNIDSARLTIKEGKLNIKFASNGTGKSTIAKAIYYGYGNIGGDMDDLVPFKYREVNPDNMTPSITGLENVTSIMCFDEEYVNKVTFQQDELIRNSFDVLIRTDAYKTTEREISKLILATQEQFTNNSELETLMSNLKELSAAFNVTAAGNLSKASTGMKGLAGGNKITHIPKGLEEYQPFIQSQKSVNWIDWQSKGHKEFSELSESCPFCTKDATDRKDRISRVSQEYNKNLIKNLIAIIEVIGKLGDYFSNDARERLGEITLLKEGMEKEHETFIINTKLQIDTFISKLESLSGLSGFHFKDGENVSEKLPSYLLDLKFFDTLTSKKTQEAVNNINSSINALTDKAGILQGQINIQRAEMGKLVEQYQHDINGFLTYAGYQYRVEIVGEGDRSQLKLRHIDHSEHLNGGSQYLSFGERNAFAIVLFMYECLSKKPELIILDDPISSFDKNKKFAILEMLFRREAESCLKGKTVLMLTHDIEPIIDTLKSVRKQFDNQVSASFLRLSKRQIVELDVNYNHIKTFMQICKRAIISDSNTILKLIYLRRNFEILDDKGDAYQVLSNLFHKREFLIDLREPKNSDGQYPEMDLTKLSNGTEVIRKDIEDFDYSSLLERILDREYLQKLYQGCDTGYDKLKVFRLLAMDCVDNSVIKKFINETYHIENEFIYQLDPFQFDLVPEYVVDECDRMLET
ncbi:AAA family ATPase [Porticoccaceae bacterium]|nr:AAA family ATPase [Porticoccaceae bacterium]